MAKIIVSFKKPSRAILVRENKGEVQVQQIDEVWAIAGHAYKWLGPLHDILNMTDPADKGLFRGFLEWYQNNETTQTVMGALTAFEKQMNKAWESGGAAKAKALTIQSALTGFEPVGTTISTGIGYLLRQQRDDMEKEKLEIVEKAAAALQAAKEKAEKESQGAIAIAKVPELEAIIKQLEADIRQKEFEKAKQLFTAAEELRKATEAKKTTKTVPPSPQTRASQETMYQQNVNEKKDKKMTKKYSSFKQQQMITENFRKYINEEDFSPDEEAVDEGIFDKIKGHILVKTRGYAQQIAMDLYREHDLKKIIEAHHGELEEAFAELDGLISPDDETELKKIGVKNTHQLFMHAGLRGTINSIANKAKKKKSDSEGGKPMGISGLARTGLASLMKPQDQPLQEEEDELESLISNLDLDPIGRKGVYDLQQAIASGTKIEFADDSAKTDLLHLSANVDAKVNLGLGDYWEFIQPEDLDDYSEAYENAREALDRDHMDKEEWEEDDRDLLAMQFDADDTQQAWRDSIEEIKLSDQLGTKPNNLTLTPEKIAKIATREFSRIAEKDRTASLKAWRGKSADRFHPEGDITPEVWKIIKEKSKAWLEKNKTKKENKVRLTKRQLQKIIKEEIKKVTKKKK